MYVHFHIYVLIRDENCISPAKTEAILRWEKFMFGKPLRSYFQTSSLAVLHYIRASSDAFNVELIIIFSENIEMWKVRF